MEHAGTNNLEVDGSETGRDAAVERDRVVSEGAELRRSEEAGSKELPMKKPRPILSSGALQVLEASFPGSTTVRDGRYRLPIAAWLPLSLAPSEHSTTTVEVPENLESPATLKFFSFTDETVDHIWRKIRIDPCFYENQSAIFEMAATWIDQWEEANHDPIQQEDNWVGAFESMGMARVFIDRVMHPQWSAQRLTETACHWVYRHILDRYMFLTHLFGLVRLPPLFTVPPTQVPDHTLFFVGDTFCRLRRIIKGGGAFDVGFGLDWTGATSVFNCGRAGITLNVQPEVAMQDACWLGHFVDERVAPIAVLTIAVPNELLHDQKVILGSAWKDFVWANCRDTAARSQFHDLRDAQWIVGPKCLQGGGCIATLQSKDDLKIRYIRPGEAALQWFTSDKDTIDRLSALGLGYIWLTPLTRA